MLPVSEEALALLEKYEAHNVLDSRFRNDMLHIVAISLWQFTHPERSQPTSEKIEIRSVEMVRRIREELADILKGKSHSEIILDDDIGKAVTHRQSPCSGYGRMMTSIYIPAASVPHSRYRYSLDRLPFLLVLRARVGKGSSPYLAPIKLWR
jgi:hypothetical protein